MIQSDNNNTSIAVNDNVGSGGGDGGSMRLAPTALPALEAAWAA